MSRIHGYRGQRRGDPCASCRRFDGGGYVIETMDGSWCRECWDHLIDFFAENVAELIAEREGKSVGAGTREAGGLLKQAEAAVTTSGRSYEGSSAPTDVEAPELLAACKELHAILLDGMQRDYDDMTAALGRARVAIAKAEGR